MNFTEVWKKARVLRNDLFELSRTFPASEEYSLTDQFLRSSRSVTANMAEGHGRCHLKKNTQFCRTSRAFLSKTLDHLICAFDCGYIDKEVLKNYENQIREINRILNGYIKYLKSQLEQN